MKDESKSQHDDEIDITYFMIAGFLFCKGTPKEKVELLYNILQDGGVK